MKIKTGDNVKILSGKDRGRTGKVVQVILNEVKGSHYVVVEGVNKLKKHLRASRNNEKGQVIELPAPIHSSNVMVIDPKTDKPTRVGFKIEGGDKKRVAKASGEILN